MVASSWLLAQIVPFFSDFVNLLGSTFTPVIAFMTPMILYLLLVHKKDRVELGDQSGLQRSHILHLSATQDFTASRFEVAIIALEIGISVVMLLYGGAMCSHICQEVLFKLHCMVCVTAPIQAHVEKQFLGKQVGLGWL